MAFETTYQNPEPAPAEIAQTQGRVLLEFGTPWCGFCRAAQPALATALAEHPDVRHLKIEDGSGRRLGRTYGVKLWPTLVLLQDGAEQARLVRPRTPDTIAEMLTR